MHKKETQLPVRVGKSVPNIHSAALSCSFRATVMETISASVKPFLKAVLCNQGDVEAIHTL